LRESPKRVEEIRDQGTGILRRPRILPLVVLDLVAGPAKEIMEVEGVTID
jgi:hypothetical protein